MADPLQASLGEYEEAPHGSIESAALQQRVDRKFALQRQHLPQLLATLSADYRILRSAHRSFARYDTLYFDTVDRALYHDHRRGRRPRYKVRIRQYLDRCCSFLEVKSKVANGRTIKARMELPYGQCHLDAEARRFVDGHCPIGSLRLMRCLSIASCRVTLIGVAAHERVTLDFDIEYRDAQRRGSLPGLVIAEVKQPRFANCSPAVRALRMLHVRDEALSKFCLAAALLSPVRTNGFHPMLRRVDRLTAA